MTTVSRELEAVIAKTHCHLDPLMPDVPLVPGLKCLDHVTFVATDEAAFRNYWKLRGLFPANPIVTKRYSARHIAFTEAPGATTSCEDMVGLSVSDDPHSPVNRLVQLYGGQRVDERGEVVVGRIQHVAFAVDDDCEIADIREQLTQRRVCFMTPILMFHDTDTGAYLQQMFVACKVPYGPFAEIIKRGVGRHGEPFQGFNAEQIDQLYKYYDAYSRRQCGAVAA